MKVKRDTVWLGYHPERVAAYLARLEKEESWMENQREKERELFLTEQSELLRKIAEIQEELKEAERLESGLKQWMQINTPHSV